MKKCECGVQGSVFDLFQLYADRYWCPRCLVTEIKRLKKMISRKKPRHTVSPYDANYSADQIRQHQLRNKG